MNHLDVFFCLNCKHKFCIVCFKEYVNEKFKGGFNFIISTCPMKDCKVKFKYLINFINNMLYRNS